MTSDLGDNKEVSEDLKQPVKPASQGLNPNADAFCSKDAVGIHTHSGPSSTSHLNNPVCKLSHTEGGASVTAKDEDTGSKKQVACTTPEELSQSLTMPAVTGNSSGSLDTSMEPLPLQAHSHLDMFETEDQLGSDDIHPIDGTIPLPELKAMLQQQLEYYFSRENLATDTYLLSQMDSDQYVPIGTVANFNQIKCLTRDLNLIVDVLRDSPNVQVDDAGEKVRPSYKRCVLILREIPESTPVEEIKGLFTGENCPKFVSCEFAHNNSWYVTFESDEDAQQAYRYLREEVKTFQGRPIMARIKAKPITRASFIPPYKNGFRQPEEAEPCTSHHHQQQQQQQQQQQHQQQQQPQQQQRYTFSNMPPVTYNSQQVFPPFYPPTMLQAWAPTTPPCFDLGTVFSMNGLAPQAAFKPLGAGRHNFHTIRGRGSKSYSRIQQNLETVEQAGRFYDRNQSLPYLQRQQHVSHALNTAVSGFGFMPYPFSSKNPYNFGLDVHDLFSNSAHYSKKTDIHLPSYSAHSQTSQNPQSGNQPVRTSSKQESSSSDREAVQTSSVVDRNSSEPSKDTVSQPQPQRSRNRKKKKDESNASSKKSDPSSSDKTSSAKDPKPTCPKFDLEAASFPPLPGSMLETDVSELFESRLSDVVKGTAKPSTRDSKTQTESVPEDSLTVVTKDSATLTNGDLPSTVLTPPASPITVDNLGLEEESEQLPESSVAEVASHSCSDTSSASNTPVLVPVVSSSSSSSRVMPTSAKTPPVTTTSSSSTSSSSPPPPPPSPVSRETVSKCSGKSPLTRHSEVSIPTDTGQATVNGHVEPEVTPVIEEDKPSRKLTYSEVAQRAREKVEKLAQELKEKERQEAMVRHQRQQEMAGQSRQQVGRGSFKEFSNRGRLGDRFSFRDRRNGFTPTSERERFRHVANKSPQEDQEEPVK